MFPNSNFLATVEWRLWSLATPSATRKWYLSISSCCYQSLMIKLDLMRYNLQYFDIGSVNLIGDFQHWKLPLFGFCSFLQIYNNNKKQTRRAFASLVSKHQLTHDNQSLVDWLQAQDSQQNILSTSIWYSLVLADLLVLLGLPLADGGGRLRPGTTTGCSWGPGLSAGSTRTMALSSLG